MTMTLSFRVWDIKNKRYVQNCTQAITNRGKLIISDSDFYQHFTNTNQDDYVIEYCTGYKDVDGKYLYVNDYVEYKLGLKMVRARILYDYFAFRLAEIRGGYMDFTQQKYTLLGNSHEYQPD